MRCKLVNSISINTLLIHLLALIDALPKETTLFYTHFSAKVTYLGLLVFNKLGIYLGGSEAVLLIHLVGVLARKVELVRGLGDFQ